MQVKIKRVDKSMPLPKYYSEGAVAFDLYSRCNIDIKPNSLQRIPTNFIIEIPKGYMLYIKDRSSTAKKGLFATAGVIDQDFCGPNDEILFQVYNFSSKQVSISKGERIAQGMFLQIGKAHWQEVEELSRQKSRGGFGASGDSI